VLGYGFSENHHFTAKTDRKSVFPGHDHHITDQLYLMVLYMSFYGFFLKKSNFRPKSIGGYGFSENNHFMAKTD
jgi:hypothetical protein